MPTAEDFLQSPVGEDRQPDSVSRSVDAASVAHAHALVQPWLTTATLSGFMPLERTACRLVETYVPRMLHSKTCLCFDMFRLDGLLIETAQPEGEAPWPSGLRLLYRAYLSAGISSEGSLQTWQHWQHAREHEGVLEKRRPALRSPRSCHNIVLPGDVTAPRPEHRRTLLT